TLGFGREAADLTVEYEAEDRVGGDEPDRALGHFGQLLGGVHLGRETGQSPFHHSGQLLFDQGGDDVITVSEVLVGGGTPDAARAGDLSEGDLGGSDLGDELLRRLQDLPTGHLFVLGDGLGADPGHRGPQGTDAAGYPNSLAGLIEARTAAPGSA